MIAYEGEAACVYALATWTAATADIIQQPWHDFKQMSMSSKDPDPGIFAVVLILAKKTE